MLRLTNGIYVAGKNLLPRTSLASKEKRHDFETSSSPGAAGESFPNGQSIPRKRRIHQRWEGWRSFFPAGGTEKPARRLYRQRRAFDSRTRREEGFRSLILEEAFVGAKEDRNGRTRRIESIGATAGKGSGTSTAHRASFGFSGHNTSILGRRRSSLFRLGVGISLGGSGPAAGNVFVDRGGDYRRISPAL